MSKEHYEKLYAETEYAFDQDPSSVVVKALEYISCGKVLDLGAGAGRNSLFLAEKGFDVTAIDYANTGIERLNQQAGERGLRIKTVVGDLNNAEITDGADLVVVSRVLHCLTKEEAQRLIAKIKAATCDGGINVLDVITKDSDFYKEFPITKKFYPGVGEIKDLYKNWQVLEEEFIIWEADKNNRSGTRMQNTSQQIILKKPIASK